MKFIFVCLVAVAWVQLAQAQASVSYEMYAKEVNYLEADRICKRDGGFLATVDDDATFAAIKSYIQSTMDLRDNERNSDYWIGRNDIAEEREFYNVDGQRSTHYGLCAGQPDNAGNEDCIHYWAAPKCFNDLPCDARKFFLCAFPA